MSMYNDGGPAFPRPYSLEVDGAAQWSQEGMSLRDYFAAAAITGMYSSGGHKEVAHEIRTEQAGHEMNLSWSQIGHLAEGRLAAMAYAVADAMLVVREAR